jgi:thiol:disulfide interchange protein DsbA
MSHILFDGVQKYSTINKPEDIRQAFLDAGVTAQEYDNSLNSFLVNSLIAQQLQLLKEAKIYGVPSLLVNKKYRIHPENFSTKHGIQGFTQQYLQLTKQLLVAER